MRHDLKVLCVVLSGLFATPLFAAEPAGKVLVSVGDSRLVRQGQNLALKTGDDVQAGDTVQVGPGSNVQLRFTDQSIVALRAGTVFRVEEYAFSGNNEQDRSVFSLLRGGLRTLTGLIGKASPKSYQVKTPTSTIGIRGTHYALLICDGDCRNPDGSLANNGLFGSIVDGRISVTNSAGEEVFGRNSFFTVADANSAARSLISPPAFLSDQLEGRQRSRRGAATGDGVRSSGNLGASISQRAQAISAERRTLRQAAFRVGDSNLLDEREFVVKPYRFALASSLSRFAIPADASVEKIEGDVRTGEFLYAFNPRSGDTPFDLFTEGRSVSLTRNYTTNGQTGQSNAQLDLPDSSFAGINRVIGESNSYSADGSAATHDAAWGVFKSRLTEEFQTGPRAGTETKSDLLGHWLVAKPATNLPTSGRLSYAWVAGTRPTGLVTTAPDQVNLGTLTSNGVVSVDFTSRKISATPITWTMAGTGSAYKVEFVDRPLQLVQTSSTANNIALTGVCTTGCSASTAEVAPTLFGQGGRGVGLAIATAATLSTGGKESTSSVQIYKAQ